MKTKKILLSLLTLSVSVMIHAYDAKINGIYYDFSAGNKATVTYQNYRCFNSLNDIPSGYHYEDEDIGGDEEYIWIYHCYYSDMTGSITIPSTVTYNGMTYQVTGIGQHAFDNCSGITSITIPSSVTSIGYEAFYGCSDITSITIPNSVTSFGSDAFYGCSGINTVNVKIPDYSGISANGNQYLYLPASATWNYYINNELITSLNIPSSVTHVGSGAFYNAKNLTSITIPSSVTSIGSSAFSGCSGITSITIPNSVTSIGSSAFSGCSGITSITIPNSVTSIGRSAFTQCNGTTTVKIGNSVTSIGNYAFYGCSSLTSVTVDLRTPLSIDSNCFSHRSLATLYVPYGCKAAYEESDYWNEFKEIVEMTPSPNIEFADAAVKALCVANWDTDGDGELSEAEAAVVNNLGDVFKWNQNIQYFNELQHFTGLTGINERTFSGCSGLMSIAIPNSVTYIGNYAFYGCSSLTSITIPNSVNTIDYLAFDDCSGLTSITIPESVTSINCSNSTPFRGCSGLTSISVAPGNPNYDSRNNCNAIIKKTNNRLVVGCKNTLIPESVTSIGQYAFEGCSGLTSITIPESVVTIGNYAFYGCSSLTSITIPENVTNIYGYAFNGCTSLTSLTIGSSVTSIGGGAFYYCTGLTSVTIPNSVTTIGDDAFFGCSGLTSITIPNSVMSIGNYAFNCPGLISVTLNSDAVVSKAYAPESQSGSNMRRIFGSQVKEYIIGEEVTSIGKYAFINCTSLTSIIIPNSVTSIAEYAFAHCSNLTSVTIGNSVTSIGDYAFSNCSSLTYVNSLSGTPPNIGNYTFNNCANATLVVPTGSKAAYQAANYWKDFNRIIEFIEGDVNGDGELDVLDVVDIARYVVGTPAETFVPILADIDNSGEVNIGDAVCLVNEIAGDQNFARSMAPRHTAAEEMLTLALQDDNSLSLALQNMRDYTAFQFDLYVPKDVDVMQMMLNAQRKQKHQLLYNKVEEGHWRVAAISTSNRTFLNNSGELLSIMPADVLTDNVTISDIHFFTPDGGDYTFSELSLSSTTAIANLSLHPSSKGEVTIYDLSGRRMEVSSASMLPRGVYIIDGKKVVIK